MTRSESSRGQPGRVLAHLRSNAWGTTEQERSATRRLLVSVAGAAIVSSVALMLDMAGAGRRCDRP